MLFIPCRRDPTPSFTIFNGDVHRFGGSFFSFGMHNSFLVHMLPNAVPFTSGSGHAALDEERETERERRRITVVGGMRKDNS